jgi:predicted ATPase
VSTRLIGREHDLAQLSDLVASHRLITVTGPPGVGKSHLTRALVDRLHDEQGIPWRWCDAAEIDEGDDLASALAGSLAFSSLDALLLALGDGRSVLVLDGCEHAVSEVAPVLRQVLDGCPDVRVLATSRQALGLSDEFAWVVAPLPVPSGPVATGEDLLTNPAVELYLARRAATGAPGGEDAGELEAIGHLVRELDGLPLAIELAASRARSLGPGDLLQRVDRQLDLLRGVTGPGSAETGGLRAALDVSYELLSVGEQALLRALSVFRGPVAADLVHAVCAADDEDEVTTLDELSVLAQRSLVQTERGASGVVRYRLLNVVRRYAADQLDLHGERDRVEERCIERLAAMADAFAANASEGWSDELVARMLGCFANLVGTIELALRRDHDAGRAFRLYLPLYSAVHGVHAGQIATLGRRMLDRWPSGDEPLRAEATSVVAAAHLFAGQPDAAVALAERSLHEGSGSALGGLLASRTLAFAAFYDQRIDDSLESIDRAVDMAGSWGGPFERELRVVRAAMRGSRDRLNALEELEAVARESAALSEAVNQMWALVVAAHLLVREGQEAEAEATIHEAKRLADAIDHPWGRGASLRVEAVLFSKEHGWDAARRRWWAALDASVAVGDRGAVALTIGEAAGVAASLGHRDDAERLRAARVSGWAPTILPSMVPSSGSPPSIDLPLGSLAESVRRAREVLALEDHPAAAPATSASGSPDALVRRGDTWSATFDGETAVVRHVKGLGDLARLLASPSVEVHCLDLVDAAVVESDTGPTLDRAARAAYEKRIRELQADIDEAAANHDTAREELASAELDALVDQLSQAVGRGGRDRPANATVERARAAVRWRLRAAIERLGEHHPSLGHHLDRAVKTGTWCVYDPESPVTWQVDTGRAS